MHNMAHSGFDLIAVGLNAVDVLVRLPTEVRHDDKQQVDDLIIQGGAPVGSGSAGVAMLGYRVAMVAKLGENTLSEISLEQFRRYGVSTDLVLRDGKSRPAIALVQIDPVTASRTVFIQMDDYGYVRPHEIPRQEIRRSRVLLVDSYDLDATEEALQSAQGTGCRTVLDFESGDPDRLRRLLALGTDPILPLASGQRLTACEAPEGVLHRLADLTAGTVVVTDGRRGSWGLDRESGRVRHQAAFAVASIDSTGCGDAFHAGCIVGILEGWPLHLRMEFGSLLAARVSTRVGGRTALPRRAEVPALLNPEVTPALSAALRAFCRPEGNM